MIYLIKKEELCQNKANSSLVCTRNCEMDFFRLFHSLIISKESKDIRINDKCLGLYGNFTVNYILEYKVEL